MATSEPLRTRWASRFVFREVVQQFDGDDAVPGVREADGDVSRTRAEFPNPLVTGTGHPPNCVDVRSD